jgi:hypothetical protein
MALQSCLFHLFHSSWELEVEGFISFILERGCLCGVGSAAERHLEFDRLSCGGGCMPQSGDWLVELQLNDCRSRLDPTDDTVVGCTSKVRGLVMGMLTIAKSKFTIFG